MLHFKIVKIEVGRKMPNQIWGGGGGGDRRGTLVPPHVTARRSVPPNLSAHNKMFNWLNITDGRGAHTKTRQHGLEMV